jgi:hypothetical protein
MPKEAAEKLFDRNDVPGAEKPEWERLRRRTLVDQAADAIIAGVARGLILPGDRIVEAELARQLGIRFSRRTDLPGFGLHSKNTL